MASTKEYLDFILEQLSELDEITYKAMMGEYIIYYRGKIVGGAILFPDKDRLNIGRIFVSPEHHRKGYGIYMMQEIEAMFSDAKEFTLDTPIWNVRTNAFLRNLLEAMYDELPEPKKKK